MTPRPLLVAALSAVLGCGGGAGPSAPPSPRASFDELAEVLKAMHEQRVKPPTKSSDLTRYEPIAESGVAAVKKGEVVYLWGAGYQAGSSAVIAHPKDAANAGGWVLLQDGTVKEMTAAEFAAAPKAGGKK